MAPPCVLIFHRPATDGDALLVRVLAAARRELAERQAAMLERAGAARADWITEWQSGMSFGEVLAEHAPARDGLITFGSGAVARLRPSDARALTGVAAASGARALTNNRYSSDICAVSRAAVLRALPALPSDNSLPRWLEEHAGYGIAELPGRQRLALDLDTPLDIALAALAPGAPAWLREVALEAGLAVPRLAELRRLAADPHAELLVFGRSGARTLRWLERNVRCRVRFLAEERGLRASTPLAIAARGGGRATDTERRPRATIGLLLDRAGADELPTIIGELADGALIDTRVLFAHRLGVDEEAWPAPADRYASDLLLPAQVGDQWLHSLTAAAARSPVPILLGSHTLLGPGLPILLAGMETRAG